MTDHLPAETLVGADYVIALFGVGKELSRQDIEVLIARIAWLETLAGTKVAMLESQAARIAELEQALLDSRANPPAWAERDRLAYLQLQLERDALVERLAELTAPSAPTAWIEVSNGEIVGSGFYAPGLPDGTHDLYPVGNCTALPPKAAHTMVEVLAITDAYESGMGQGLKNRPMGEYQNPYDPVHSPHESRAYGLGYDEGVKRSALTKEPTP